MDAAEMTRSLMERAATYFMADGETSPDPEWWRDYFTLHRTNMIRTEEGWEPAGAEASYLIDDPEWKPLERLTFDDPQREE